MQATVKPQRKGKGKVSLRKKSNVSALVLANPPKPPSLDEIAKRHGLSQIIYVKLDPLTGKRDVFSRCSKCGMLGTCKIIEEQTVQLEGVPFRFGIARCFWMDHNFRILLSQQPAAGSTNSTQVYEQQHQKSEI